MRYGQFEDPESSCQTEPAAAEQHLGPAASEPLLSAPCSRSVCVCVCVCVCVPLSLHSQPPASAVFVCVCTLLSPSWGRKGKEGEIYILPVSSVVHCFCLPRPSSPVILNLVCRA